MCCFSGPVRFVAGTRIFARRMGEARQALVYAMEVEFDRELAMVLPLPVPPASPEGAVSFVSLARYDRFFDDMMLAFPPEYSRAPQALLGARLEAAAPMLAVHDVGLFEASFVPSRADFARLDARFRLPAGAWDRLPQYGGWGFVVCRLKPGKKKKRQRVHPMAFTFPSREPGALFFPTVHVHDGKVHERARFDHSLYAQAEGVLEATLGWRRSEGALGARMNGAATQGLVDVARGGFMMSLAGEHPNADVWLRPPAGVEVADLRGQGRSYAYAVDGSRAYGVHADDADERRWGETAATRLGPLCRGLRDGLRELEAARGEVWRLTELTDALPPRFMNGDKLWAGTTMDGHRASGGSGSGPGRVIFRPFTARVPPQWVTFGFAELPDEDRIRDIRAELARLLDRVAGK
jgi:hypothetical protein